MMEAEWTLCPSCAMWLLFDEACGCVGWGEAALGDAVLGCGRRCHSSSVTNGMKGCSNLRSSRLQALHVLACRRSLLWQSAYLVPDPMHMPCCQNYTGDTCTFDVEMKIQTSALKMTCVDACSADSKDHGPTTRCHATCLNVMQH